MNDFYKRQEKNFFLRERQIRKARLLDLIEKHPELGLKKIKGLFSLRTGLSFKKIQEYLSEFLDAELIEIDNGNVRKVK